MDRPLEQNFLQRRTLRRILKFAIPAAAAAGLIVFVSSLLRPSVGRDEIGTATVGRGRIEGTISAAGTVVPVFEQAISSPTPTRILAVRKRPGDSVKKGESILDLDQSELRLTLDRTEKALNLQENKKEQLRLDIARTLENLDGQLSIKSLRLEYLASKSVQGSRMMEIGAISRDQLEQIRLEERIAAIEKTDLESSIRSTKLSLDNQLAGLMAEVRSLAAEKSDIERQIRLLACPADRDGVVTWVQDRIGSGVARGDVVARVADLSAYRIDAALSDVHATRLVRGMQAIVQLNGTELAGTLETVFPSVENGTVRIGIALADAGNSRLRPSLRVDVSLVTGSRDGVLTLKKGGWVTGGSLQQVFVVRGDAAKRTAVTTGIQGIESVEILDGLAEGDEVIVSDMSAYEGVSDIMLTGGHQ